MDSSVLEGEGVSEPSCPSHGVDLWSLFWKNVEKHHMQVALVKVSPSVPLYLVVKRGEAS